MTPALFVETLDTFFAALPRDAPYAVEVRNDEFLTPAYFAVLREHGVTHVLNNWTRMPTIGEQLDLPGVLTGPFLVARALLRIGRTYEEAVDAFAPYDRIREPNPGLRRDLVRVARTAVETRLPAYILVNNRVEGSAPLTVLEVVSLFGEGVRDVTRARGRRPCSAWTNALTGNVPNPATLGGTAQNASLRPATRSGCTCARRSGSRRRAESSAPGGPSRPGRRC